MIIDPASLGFSNTQKTYIMTYIIKPLNWVNNPSQTNKFKKVESIAEIKISGNESENHIEIVKRTWHAESDYQVNLFIFDKYMQIESADSFLEAKLKANRWWNNFVKGFLTSEK